MKSRQFVVGMGLTATLVIVMCVVLVFLARTGYEHVDPASMLRVAGEKWGAGQYGASISQYVQSAWMAVDAGARYTLLPIYFGPMNQALRDGNLIEAQRLCAQGIALIHPYDDEGTVSHVCFTIDERIRFGH